MWIYKITNEINNKIYIGQTKVSVHRRWSQHKRNALKSQKYALYQAMHKYGIENFKIEILTETNSKEELDLLEKKYIKENNSFVNQNGYNMTKGGEGCSATDELRSRLSILKKEKYASGEIVAKPHSEETKEKMSMAQRGKKHSEERISKMRAALKGRKLSEEHKAKTSATLKGKKQSKIKCPHCPKSGGQSNMTRYHFDNCKLKPQG